MEVLVTRRVDPQISTAVRQWLHLFICTRDYGISSALVNRLWKLQAGPTAEAGHPYELCTRAPERVCLLFRKAGREESIPSTWERL